MKKTIVVNDREMTLAKYFKHIAIMGDSAYAGTKEGSATAIIIMGTLTGETINSIARTLYENGISIATIEWTGDKSGRVRIWILLVETPESDVALHEWLTSRTLTTCEKHGLVAGRFGKVLQVGREIASGYSKLCNEKGYWINYCCGDKCTEEKPISLYDRLKIKIRGV